jgi:hypothetical protein
MIYRLKFYSIGGRVRQGFNALAFPTPNHKIKVSNFNLTEVLYEVYSFFIAPPWSPIITHLFPCFKSISVQFPLSMLFFPSGYSFAIA